MILPDIWKNEIHVPNHQPVYKMELRNMGIYCDFHIYPIKSNIHLETYGDIIGMQWGCHGI